MAKVLGFLIGFLGTFYLGYVSVWQGFIVPLVPAGDYKGLILLVLAVVLFMVFGGIAIMLAGLVGGFLGTLFGGVAGK